MSKDPAFLFYYQDFLVGTDSFSNEEIGAYIRCLCYQAHKGAISESHIQKICSKPKILEVVMKKFVPNGDGETYYNERLKTEIETRKEYAESRRKNRQRK